MNNDKKGIAAIVGGSVAIFWYGAFIFGFPGVMAQDWQVAFQAGRGEIGNILFFVLAGAGSLMFFVGRWQSRVGIRWMVTVGTLICGLNLLLIAWASRLWMLYLWAFLMGAGSCFVYVPAITSVQQWYPARRGTVSGIVNFTFGFSGAVMVPLFRYLLHNMGYAAMTLWMALFAAVTGLVAAQGTAPPSPGLAPLVPASSGSHAFVEVSDNSLTVKQSVRTRSFWFLWLTWSFQGAAGIALVTLSTGFGLSRGFTAESAVLILMAFNVTNGLGRLVSGYVSDVFGRNSTMSLSFFAAGIAYLTLTRAEGLASCAGLAAVIGLAFGTLFAVSAPLVMDCFGPKHFGAVFGLIFTAYGFVAGPLGPSLSGYLLDATNGSFTLVFGYLGGFCILSSVLIRFVVPPLPVRIQR